MPFFGDRLKLAPGEEPLPGYRLIEHLTQTIWKATAPDGSVVALKCVSKEGEMAQGELRAFPFVSKLRHDNLLRLYAAAEVKDRVVVAMELCEHDLATLYRIHKDSGRPGIPRDELLSYVTEIAQGLDFLNARNHPDEAGGGFAVAHCDITPGNLLLKDGHIKLADFGITIAFTDEPARHSNPRFTSFTAPPEAHRGEVYATSDQYSLAALYSYLLNGALARPGGLNQKAIDTADFTAAEQATISRAMAPDPGARWPTCAEFVNRLKG